MTAAPQNVSFAEMSARQQQAVKLLLQDPDVATISSFIGIDGTNETVNTGRMQIALRPHAERKFDAMQIMEHLQQQLTGMTGLQFYLQPVQDLTVEDRISRTQYQLTLESADEKLLAVWVPKLVDSLRAQPELSDVTDDMQNDGINTFVDIDRDAAARLGVTAAMIDDALYDAFGQRQISTVFTQSNQYRVVLETAPQFRRDPSALGAVYVKTSDGKPVPITSVAKFPKRAPLW